MIYQSQYKETLNDIKDKLSNPEYDQKVLEKQIKVYNYYNNKLLTKKYVIKILKLCKWIGS